MGITSLKQHDVVNRLREACENGSVNARQGAFGAFECLSERLGMLFEPYITTIVPVLLKSFSHGSDLVREAAQMAAKAIMGRLSAHGVKVVRPVAQGQSLSWDDVAMDTQTHAYQIRREMESAHRT